MTPASKKPVKPWVDLDIYHAIMERQQSPRPDEEKADTHELAFMLVMIGLLDPDGVCRHSSEELADICTVVARTIKRTRHSLIEKGYLELAEGGSSGVHGDFAYFRFSERMTQTSRVTNTSRVTQTSRVTKTVRTGDVNVPPRVTQTSRASIQESFNTLNGELKGRGSAAAPPADQTKNPDKPKKPARKLWPAPQPPAVTAVTDKHDELWLGIAKAAIGEPWQLNEFIESVSDPGTAKLLDSALGAIGGPLRLHNFIKRPRDANIAQEKFLKYLLNHDPAYEAAIARAVEESLEDKPKSRSARASPG